MKEILKAVGIGLTCGVAGIALIGAAQLSAHWATDRIWEFFNPGWTANFGVVTRNNDFREDVSKCNIYHAFRNAGIDHPEVQKLLVDYNKACDRLADDAQKIGH